MQTLRDASSRPKAWLLLCVSLLVYASPAAARRRVKIGAIDLSFELSSNFRIGRFEQVEGFRDAAVLIEATQLGEYSVDAIPVGAVPVIWLDVITKEDVAFLRRNIPAFETYRTKVAGREVWKLPGFPGPYGEGQFCYIVPIGLGGRSVQITGNRYYRAGYGEQGPATHYDVDIERVIATLAR
jgi:hypothetical protein